MIDRPFRYGLFVLFAFLTAATANSQERSAIDGLLGRGEFAAAKHVALQQLPADRRDPALARIAIAQSQMGSTAAATQTVRQIDSPQYRQQAVAEAGQPAGAGGGSFADFQSLMDLIQTTVVPDTWDILGGPSSMSPYPQGVFVDAQGTVQACETFAADDAVAELSRLLRSDTAVADSTGEAWRSPAKLRVISLRRLLDEWHRLQIQGAAVPDSMTHMAGLSQIQYMMIEGDDILLAGPVGGIASDNGWLRDRESGLPTWRLDFFITALQSSLGNQPFGCTIDPSTEGLQQAAVVAQSVAADRIPIGKAAGELRNALGMQRVEVFGTAGDTPIGYLMVEADRHMKELALGIHPMPRGVANYLDAIEASIEQGPPKDLLLRLWFTASPRAVRADVDRKVFELAGTPIRLSGQNERALASGRRGEVTRDFRSEAFVTEFNENWHAIRSSYPIYGALESVYRSASVAELLRRHATEPEQQSLLQSLAQNEAEPAFAMRTPRQVESIAKLHTVRHGSKRHHILIASGGVSVSPEQTVTANISDYPSLASLNQPKTSQPRVIQRWWWNAQ